MKKKKNVSSLYDHKLHKKKGLIATPLNEALRDQIKLSSWTKERMPEYLWLGLILLHYGRKNGFVRIGNILSNISQEFPSLSHPKLSSILCLSDDDQRRIYGTICRFVDHSVLAPLTLLYRSNAFPIFNEFFFISHSTVDDRIKILCKAVKTYSPHQSNEATDLRYMGLSLLLLGGKIHVSRELDVAPRALKEYPYTDHADEKMRLYRPTIRSMEGIGFTEDSSEFCAKFWRDIGMITPCNPVKIEFGESTDDNRAFISDCQRVLEYVLYSNKERSLSEDKFDVLVGSVNYALKIFIEINEKSVGNSILGRHAVRTIIEVYIILKYLLKREPKQPQIWQEYKLYGISKYKLLLLKSRETDLNEKSHFVPLIAEVIVNEIRWEEFIDVDLKYFDKQGMREKSIEVDEKELYDLLYDYDSSFSHGLWGAIRESAMLRCDNPNHRYHAVPDIHSDQNLPEVVSDATRILKMIFSLLGEVSEIPEWFSKKYDRNK